MAIDRTPSLTHRDLRVLITAGGAGIGLNLARRLLAAGAQVMVADVNEATLQGALQAHPTLARAVADVSREDSVLALFDAVRRHLGGLDVLVNGAGIAGPTAPVDEIRWDDWRACLGVNLDGAFLCSRSAIPMLRANAQGGSIIHMGSTAGLFGFPRRAPYAAAKWALRGLTRTMAQELGPEKIRVNCVCPGSVEGERIDRVIAAEAEKTGQTIAAVRASFVAASSMRSFVTADDIADTVLFLTGPGGRMISGQEIVVDGHTETL